MSDDISNPLLALIKERGLIDDLQYRRSRSRSTSAPASRSIQILQDFGIMDLDDILQVIADHLGTEVVIIARIGIHAGADQDHSGRTPRACTNACRWRVTDSTVQVALADPLNPARDR